MDEERHSDRLDGLRGRVFEPQQDAARGRRSADAMLLAVESKLGLRLLTFASQIEHQMKI